MRGTVNTAMDGYTCVWIEPCADRSVCTSTAAEGDDSTKSSRMLETLDGFVALHVTRKAQQRSSRPQSIRSNQCPARLMPFLFAPSVSEVQRCACLRGTGGVESPRQLWLLDSQDRLVSNRNEPTFHVASAAWGSDKSMVEMVSKHRANERETPLR